MKSIFEEEEQDYGSIDGRRKRTEEEDGVEKTTKIPATFFIRWKLHKGSSFAYNISCRSNLSNYS